MNLWIKLNSHQSISDIHICDYDNDNKENNQQQNLNFNNDSNYNDLDIFEEKYYEELKKAANIERTRKNF